MRWPLPESLTNWGAHHQAAEAQVGREAVSKRHMVVAKSVPRDDRDTAMQQRRHKNVASFIDRHGVKALVVPAGRRSDHPGPQLRRELRTLSQYCA